MNDEDPVLAGWEEYVFPETSLPKEKPRVAVRDPLPPVAEGHLPPLDVVDPGGARTAVELEKLLTSSEKKPINYHGANTERDQVLWLNVSPFDVYLERVFAEKLSDVE